MLGRPTTISTGRSEGQSFLVADVLGRRPTPALHLTGAAVLVWPGIALLQAAPAGELER
jgi:hypothetical protein